MLTLLLYFSFPSLNLTYGSLKPFSSIAMRSFPSTSMMFTTESHTWVFCFFSRSWKWPGVSVEEEITVFVRSPLPNNLESRQKASRIFSFPKEIEIQHAFQSWWQIIKVTFQAKCSRIRNTEHVQTEMKKNKIKVKEQKQKQGNKKWDQIRAAMFTKKIVPKISYKIHELNRLKPKSKINNSTRRIKFEGKNIPLPSLPESLAEVESQVWFYPMISRPPSHSQSTSKSVLWL